VRIIITGTTGSGKTTLGARLAKVLNIKHIDLDDLHWLPNWRERSDEEFLALLQEELEHNKHWIIVGNYSVTKPITWPQATHFIWLNYPFRVVLYRSVKRAITRIITREKICNGNVESFRQTFFSRESVLWWMFKTFKLRKEKTPIEIAQLAPNAQVIELTAPKDANSVENQLKPQDGHIPNTGHSV